MSLLLPVGQTTYFAVTPRPRGDPKGIQRDQDGPCFGTTGFLRASHEPGSPFLHWRLGLIREEIVPAGRQFVAVGHRDEPTIRLTADRKLVHGLRGFRRIAYAVRVADAVCGIATVIALEGMSGAFAGASRPLLVIPISAAVWITVFQLFGMYRLDHLSAWEEFRGAIGAAAVSLVLTLAATSWLGKPVSRSGLPLGALLVVGSELVLRRGLRSLVTRIQRAGGLSLRTALVGANAEAIRLAHALSESRRGLVPVGYVAVGGLGPEGDGFPVIGDIDALEAVIREHEVECVVVAATAASPSDLLRVSRACRRTGAVMKVSANLPDALSSRMSVHRLGDVITVDLKPVRLTGRQAAIKRSFDVVVGSVVLLLALPVMAVVALAIRLTSSGPVLFRQQRGTTDGEPFTMLKFRTMVEDSDEALDGAVIDLTRPFFKMKDDPRLTTVGRMLRKVSLDELPQLWNVLRGDMRLVGPRPLPFEQVEANAAALAPRHEVRAGLTGWWQISGRSELDSEEALRLDVFYIENWSVGLDLYILFRTFGTVLGRKGAL
jgi:exopolysaccharide biosynthesis polyprenyl glycosylphosphotransferase